MNNISTPLFTLLGILLGWSLTQIGQWYKGRKDDNRIRCQVLYNLLEIHHLLISNTVNIANYLDTVIQCLAKYIPEMDTNKELQKQFANFFSPIIDKFIKEKFVDEFGKIEKNYKASIMTLAPIDPIIAYYLSGQTSGITYVNAWISRIIDEIGTHITDKTELEKGKDEVTNVFEQKIYTDSLNEIKTLILKLATKIGFKTKWRVNNILSKRGVKPEDNNELIQFLDGIISQLNKNEIKT